MTTTTLGAYIRRVRLEQGLTLQQAAQRMDMNFTYLSKIENGHITPTSKTLAGIANALNGSLTEMLRLSESVPSEVQKRLEDEQKARLAAQSLAPLARSASDSTQAALVSLEEEVYVSDSVRWPLPDVLIQALGIPRSEAQQLAVTLERMGQMKTADRQHVLEIVEKLVSTFDRKSSQIPI
ncbi:MAG: helix-turn-helix domain-containing protein [Anaerolineae bacterium]